MAIRLNNGSDSFYGVDGAYTVLDVQVKTWFMASQWVQSAAGFGAGEVWCNRRENATGRYQGFQLVFGAGTPYMRFVSSHSTTQGVWRDPANIVSGAWTLQAYSYDNGLTTNNPTAARDGSAITPTLQTTPVGTPQSLDSIVIGAQTSTGLQAVARNANQSLGLGPMAIWTQDLGAEWLAFLTNGFSPLFFPVGLAFYRENHLAGSGELERQSGGAFTQNGSPTKEAHPPIAYPDWYHDVAAISGVESGNFPALASPAVVLQDIVDSVELVGGPADSLATVLEQKASTSTVIEIAGRSFRIVRPGNRTYFIASGGNADTRRTAVGETAQRRKVIEKNG